MPKLPGGNGKAGSDTARKPPAKSPAKGATATKRRPARRKPAEGAAKPKTAEAGNGRPVETGAAPAATRVRERDFERRPVDEHRGPVAVGPTEKLTEDQRVLLGDLFAVVEEHASEAAEEVDKELVEHAFVFACERHADQRRASGEDFIVHPVGVAKICAGMRLDTATLCAALLHDTVEDTTASLAEVEEDFGEQIAKLVDGVTKLSGVTFQSRDDRQAENYRKMMVAMAQDIRVILIKLADRLHNMRTIGSMPKHKQQEKAKETLEIFAPLAHRLGIHAIKWELEDLAFATLHPRKYNEIKQLVSQQRSEREGYVSRAGQYLGKELEAVGIEAEIAGRAKHFYSIYSKMTKKGREFNEIYDLTAMRVLVGSVKDCYGAIGVIHSLWKPLPGRFKDWVAMPKFNMYQALHTTVIGPEGRPARDPDPHVRDAPHGGVRRRGALDLQGGRRQARRAEGRVAAPPARLAAGDQGPAGVRRDAQGRPVRGRGLRLHAEGRGQVARERGHAARLRLLDPHRRGPPLRRAPRSTARSCRCTTSSSRATSARC